MTRVLLMLTVCWSTMVFAEFHGSAAQVVTSVLGQTPTETAEKKQANEKLQTIFYYAVRDKKWDEIRDIIRQPGFDPNFMFYSLSRWSDGHYWEPLFKVLVNNGQFELALELAKLPGFDVKARGTYRNPYEDRVHFFQDKIISKTTPPQTLPPVLESFLSVAFDQSRPALLGPKEKELFEIIMKDKLTGDFDPSRLSNVTDPFVMRRVLEMKPDLSREDKWGKPVSESTRESLSSRIRQYQTLNNIEGEINEREKKIEGMKQSLAILNRYAPETKKK